MFKIFGLHKNLSFKIVIIALTVLIVIAFIDRTVGIFSNMILFIFDSARDLLYVKKIVVDHKILLIGPSSGGLQGYFQGVSWYYLLAIPFLIGKGNPAGMTLFMAIMSTASVLAVFFLLKKMTNYYGAFLGAVVFVFASFSLATAKFIWNPYPIVWLMPFFFFAFHEFIRRKAYALPLASLIAGFVFNFEAIYGICLLPVLAVLFVWHFSLREKLRKKMVIFFLSIVLFSLPLLPTLLFDLRHHFLISRAVIGSVISGGATITHSSQVTYTPFPKRIVPRLQDLYLFTAGSITANMIVNFLLFLIFLYGIYRLWITKEKHYLSIIGLSFLTLLIPLGFFLTLKYAVWSYYWIGSSPLYVMVFAYVITQAFKKVFVKKKFLYLLLLALIILANNPFPAFTLWHTGEIQQGPQTLKTQLAIVKTIYADANGKKFSAYVLTPPVYDYVYRYLFWWQGRENENLKTDQKQHLTYVIIEQNPSDPTGTYFIKNTVRTNNKPVKVFTFPGNVTVEKILTSPEERPADTNYFPQL